ncbi:MAG: zinc ribbon domain-containing protein [Anaerovoracaceae bacterium]|nr:zinc ribbon domain-containing protein [Anaerovoracaceae bacterium]
MSYCSQCGKELVQGAKFCQNCGAPVESAAAAGTGAAGDGSASANTSSGDSSSASYAGYYERQNAQSQNAQRQNAQPNYNYAQQDIPSTGLNVLAFFLPLVGLILYLVYIDSTPKRAKAIGKFALIGFGVGVALGIIGAVIQGAVIASMFF